MIFTATPISKFPWRGKIWKFDWKAGSGCNSPSSRILHPTDRLSVSPSLVLILSYLDIDDVDECQLVCRLFRAIIKGNKKYIQPVIDIDLYLHKEGDAKGVRVVMETMRGIRTRRKRVIRRMVVVVMPTVVRIEKCVYRGSFFDSYRAALHNRPISCTREGLQAVIGPLFQRFPVTLALFDKNTKRTQLFSNFLASLFERKKGICDMLSLYSKSDLPYLLDKIKANTVVVDLRRAFHDFLAQFLQSCQELIVCVDHKDEIGIIDLIVEYIKGWLAGAMLVKDSIIFDTFGRPFKATRRIHEAVVASLNYGTYYLTTRPYFKGADQFEFLLRRPMDDMILFISYTDDIRIEHFVIYGKLENTEIDRSDPSFPFPVEPRSRRTLATLPSDTLQ